MKIAKVLLFMCLCTIRYCESEEDEENYETIEFGEPCSEIVDLFRMFGTSVHAGEVNIRWQHDDSEPQNKWLNDKCELRFRGYYVYGKLAFQFTTVDMGYNDCIDVKQRGRFGDRDYEPIFDPNYYSKKLEVCGRYSDKLNTVYTTDNERDLVLSFKMESSGYKRISLVFNVYNTDEDCDQYLCHNGRCIPDDIQCNPNNPCGDESSCKRLTGWEIFGVVVGCIAGLIFLCCCCCYCCKNKKDSPPVPISTVGNAGQESVPLNDTNPAMGNNAVNTTPVFVYATVSNQTNSGGPPMYATLSNTQTDTTPSLQGYYTPSTHITTDYSNRSRPNSGQFSNIAPSAPYAPSMDDSAAIAPPPPSYDEVVGQEEKYKVT